MKRSSRLILIVFLIAGCASVNDLRNAKNDPGGVETFDATYEDTFDMAVKVLKFQGADILDTNKDKQYIYAKQGISYIEAGIFSYGELLGLYFEKISPNKTKLKIVEKKRVKTTILKQDWTLGIFSDMRNQLHYRAKLSQPT